MTICRSSIVALALLAAHAPAASAAQHYTPSCVIHRGAITLRLTYPRSPRWAGTITVDADAPATTRRSRVRWTVRLNKYHDTISHGWPGVVDGQINYTITARRRNGGRLQRSTHTCAR